MHGDINPNTIIILDWPASSMSRQQACAADGDGTVHDDAARGDEDGARTDGALVDFDYPVSVAARRKLVNPDPAMPPPRRRYM